VSNCCKQFWKRPAIDFYTKKGVDNTCVKLTVSRSATSSGDALGWLRMWLWTTNLASRSSSTGSTVSRTTHRMSKRDKIGSVRSTWTYSFTASNLHSYNILFSYRTSLHFGFREPLVLLDIMPFCYTSTNKRNKKSHAGFTRLKKIKEQVFKKTKKRIESQRKVTPIL